MELLLKDMIVVIANVGSDNLYALSLGMTCKSMSAIVRQGLYRLFLLNDPRLYFDEQWVSRYPSLVRTNVVIKTNNLEILSHRTFSYGLISTSAGYAPLDFICSIFGNADYFEWVAGSFPDSCVFRFNRGSLTFHSEHEHIKYLMELYGARVKKLFVEDRNDVDCSIENAKFLPNISAVEYFGQPDFDDLEDLCNTFAINKLICEEGNLSIEHLPKELEKIKILYIGNRTNVNSIKPLLKNLDKLKIITNDGESCDCISVKHVVVKYRRTYDFLLRDETQFIENLHDDMFHYVSSTAAKNDNRIVTYIYHGITVSSDENREIISAKLTAVNDVFVRNSIEHLRLRLNWMRTV